ncbi:MAG: tRNA(Ile)-lysidine synthase [Flavobacteriales bacterium]|jgi:tRNA(Ile)-lysidine synthase
MLDAFKYHLQEHCSALTTAKLLIAISGGLDSMVLAHLCRAAGLDVSFAHCNFQLRDTESDGDAQFIQSISHDWEVDCHIKNFETSAFAKAHSISIQMAARELRYTWFQELMDQKKYDFVFTAHHQNDSLETFLINTGRGTGLDGLLGIPAQNGQVVRPLLFCTRKEILSYAESHQIEWREDRSNASDAYVRNQLRHHAIPAWEIAQPKVLLGFGKTQEHLQNSAALLKVYAVQLRQQFQFPIDSLLGPSGMGIDLEKLENHPETNAVLYVLLKEYGFTAWEDVYGLRTAQAGKQIFSHSHRLLKDRTTLEVYPLDTEIQKTYTWPSEQTDVMGDFGKLSADPVAALENVSSQEIIVDADRLTFPLHIRKWKEGDSFYPLGMKGKKKLSKYFKDEKLSLIAKEQLWLLFSGDEIVWIIDHRADNRYKIQPTTNRLLKITHTHEIY